MLLSARPASFPIPFGANAGGSFIRPIPVNSQIGVQDGAASLNDGFVPDNFTPIAGGGVPPFGQDMNGILRQATAWCQWVQAGSSVLYDSAFATAIGGYPQGTVLGSTLLAAAKWVSLIDNNLTNPDDPLTSFRWFRVGVQVGTPMPFLTASIPGNLAIMNGLTIGSSASGANFADPSTLFLYAFNWPNSQLSIFTSTGSITTRGANPVADFNANKRLAMPNAKGMGLIGADTMGGTASTFLSGVPVTAGNTTTPGSVVGENLHSLITAELAAHTHTNLLTDPTHTHGHNANSANLVGTANGSGNPIVGFVGATISNASTGITLTNASVGSGSGHNTVERNMIVYWAQAL